MSRRRQRYGVGFNASTAAARLLSYLPRQYGTRSRDWWRILAVTVGLAVVAVTGVVVFAAPSNSFTWREDVALHGGGSIVVTWGVRMRPAELGSQMVGERRLTFAHPTTNQPVVWENAGKVGSRLTPNLLDVDVGRLFLVTLALSGPDYDGFGCPTPPYVVFRYDAGTWTRVPLSELPNRFTTANLLGFPGKDTLREAKYHLTAAQVAARLDALRGRADTEHMGRIDRRLRNPRSLGCSRGAIERIYGKSKYREWRGTGTWLDKSEQEALKLLRGGQDGAKP